MRLKNSRLLSVSALAAVMFAVTSGANAESWDVNDWTITFDNNFLLNLGMRARDASPNIYNNTTFQNSDMKFPNFGDIVTARVSDSMELDIAHGLDYGVSFTMTAWKDFAYTNKVATAPGLANYSSSPTGIYGPKAYRYYVNGVMTGDAFAFWPQLVRRVPVHRLLAIYDQRHNGVGISRIAGQGFAIAALAGLGQISAD